MDKTKSYHFTVAKQMEAVFNFEQMVVSVQQMVQVDAKLDKNERTFLARAYKKLIDVRRETWRFFCNMDENPQDADTEEQKQARTDLRLKTHEGLLQLYREFLDVINEKLLPNANDEEASVFYHNMKGDFYRDQVDLLEEDERAESLIISEKSYEEGFTIATTKLKRSNPVRLGLALKYAVFQFEVLKLEEEARQLMQKALEDANDELCEKEAAGDTEAALLLIQKQLTAWKPKNFAEDAAQ